MRVAFSDLTRFADLALVDGAFDPLHAGHVAYLTRAYQLTHTALLCTIASDDDIRAKGREPFLPADDRATILGAIDGVMAVHVKDRPTHEILEQMRPVAYVKGLDWCGSLPAEQLSVCTRLAIPMLFTDTVQGSSSRLLADWSVREAARHLDTFERLVQTQQPATAPWHPVTDYSFEARKAIEGPHAELIHRWLLCCEDADVLDYGCGPGHLVRMLNELPQIGVASAYGYDPHAPDGVPNLTTEHPSARREWDLVICREVLEHCTILQLRQIVSTLCGLSAHLIYVTTRFAHNPANVLSVETSDDLDPTHITMVTHTLLRTLFVLEGCTRRADLEQHMDHQGKGRVLVYAVH